jgi:hypothetical protein
MIRSREDRVNPLTLSQWSKGETSIFRRKDEEMSGKQECCCTIQCKNRAIVNLAAT